MKNLITFILITISLLLQGCSHLFYYPSRSLFYPPSKLDLKYDDVIFNTDDGEKLHGWYFPAPLDQKAYPKGTIVLFHGNAENLSSHYLSLAWIIQHGYNLFVFDYRGYGQSTGEPSQKGTYLDAKAALDVALNKHQQSKGQLFVVFGQSLGGVISMNALNDYWRKDQVDLVVADSTFLSYKDVAQEKLAQFWMTWIFSPLARILISDERASSDVITHIGPRLLVIHDIFDPIVSVENGMEIYRKARCEKNMWLDHYGRHAGYFVMKSSKNRDQFLEYLEKIRMTKNLRKAL